MSPSTGRLERFLSVGHQQVRGWVSPADYVVFRALDEEQRRAGVRGPFCEIGVFQGRRFLFFYLSRVPGELAVAVDPFEEASDQEQIFRANVREHGGEDHDLRVLRSDSRTVTPEALLEVAGGRFRAFSVDGDHSFSAVASDLRLAGACMAAGGIIIVDDYFNETFPGVSEATIRYLSSPEGAAWVPFAVFSTKVFLSDGDTARRYRASLERLTASGFGLRTDRFTDREVVVLAAPPEPPRPTVFADTALWKAVRDTPAGRLLRAGRRFLKRR